MSKENFSNAELEKLSRRESERRLQAEIMYFSSRWRT